MNTDKIIIQRLSRPFVYCFLKLDREPLEGVWKRTGLYPRIPIHSNVLKQVSNTVLAGDDVK
jgi:hypothetical protein